jgi:hypothetical protein
MNVTYASIGIWGLFYKIEVKGQLFRRFVLQGEIVQLLDSLGIKMMYC